MNAQPMRRAVLSAAPAAAFLVLFYWQGLLGYFQADDFAWLSLWRELGSFGGLPRALLQPMAQGSIRPFSERIPFLAFPAVFGLEPLPFRILAFVTQILNLVLLASLGLRLTGSRWVAGLAAGFWAAATALAVPMVWISVYNQILCATVFLAGLRAWIAYCETGARRWLVLQWVLFVFGLGVLETVVVYPLIAASWRPGWRYWRTLAAMLAAGGVYALVHQALAPTPTGAYVMHVDASMLATLGEYLRQVFGGPLLEKLPVVGWLQAWGGAAPWLVGLPLGAFVAWSLWRRGEWGLLVPLALIGAPLAPVLPLRDHITHYYLVTPAAGLALALAWCCTEWYRRGMVGRLAAAAMAATLLIPSFEAARWNRDFWVERGGRVRTLVLGLVEARRLHPNAALILTGVDGQQFYASVGADALLALDLNNVFLAPGAGKSMEPIPGEPPLETFELAEAAARRAVIAGDAVVYAPAGERLRNITSVYRAIHGYHSGQSEQFTSRVEPASPLYTPQLGEGWMATGGEARWMGRRAQVSLGSIAPSKLIVEGYVPPVQFTSGPFRITVSIEGTVLGHFDMVAPGGKFRQEFDVAPQVGTSRVWQVELSADHTVALPGGDHASILISRIFLQPF